MQRDFLEKLDGGGHLVSGDMSADEKKELYALMIKYGATESTTYNRFFEKGFDEWELRGINRCKAEFISAHIGDDADLCEQLLETGAGFYEALPFMSGLRMKLVNFMSGLGMEHRTTIDKRFNADDWKEWERMGIRNIIKEFLQHHGEKKENGAGASC